MNKTCARCKEEKDEEQFKPKGKNGYRQCYCIPCQSIYRREHYLRNLKRYKSKAVIRSRKRRRVLSKWIFDYLNVHPCVDCGESDPVVLEFDHVKGKKLTTISQMISGWSLDKIESEIKKCEVRCANCHRRITAKRGGFFKYVASKT
jgi:hypothetical protein